MSFATADLVLRVAACVLLGLLAVMFLRSKRRDDAPLAGTLLCLSLMAFAISSRRGAFDSLGVLAYAFTAVCVCKVVFFWMCCEAIFSDRFRFAMHHGICIAAMAGLGVWQAGVDAPGPMAQGGAMEVAATVILNGATLAFIVAAPWSIFRGRKADLDEARRRVRNFVVPILAGYLGIVVAGQLILFLMQERTPPALVLLNMAIVCCGALGVLGSFLRIRVVNWLDDAPPMPAISQLTTLERRVIEQLQRRFVAERLYATEGLSIAQLAAQLGTHEHVLRRVINQGLGFRNFSDFLHSHRLREAAARLSDPEQQRIPVLTIALDAGFGSIGPFNRAFKAQFGVTPTQHRRRSNSTSAPPVVIGADRPSAGTPSTVH